MSAPVVRPTSTTTLAATATTVLVVDDQALQRAGIALLLGGELDISVLGGAATPAEAVRMAEELRPDVVLVHRWAPDQESIHAIRDITASVPSAAVLVLTAFGPGAFAYAALAAGARGVLTEAGGAELLAAVRTVRTGGAVLSPGLTRRLLDTWFGGPGGPGVPSLDTDGARADALTGRQRQVLELLARGRSNEEIAAALRLSVPTVKAHIKHILTRLRLHSRVQAVAFAHEHRIVTPRARARARTAS